MRNVLATAAEYGQFDSTAIKMVNIDEAMRTIADAEGVPVGIIHSSEGGSPIRAWVPIEGLETQPIFAEFLKQRRTAHGEDPEACGLELSRTGIGNYDAMLHPLVPYAIRGATWYQGESNVGEGMLYRERMAALINGWRAIWESDLPFLYVQLAPYRYNRGPNLLPEIWEALWQHNRAAQGRSRGKGGAQS